MGCNNSHGTSGRLRQAFISLVRRDSLDFQEIPSYNDPLSALGGKNFKFDWGVGITLIGEDGMPACLSWLHVDDMLAHGPTFQKCKSGLLAVLDTALQCGLVIAPSKLKRPHLVQLCCGCIYNTLGIPSKPIPLEKSS